MVLDALESQVNAFDLLLGFWALLRVVRETIRVPFLHQVTIGLLERLGRNPRFDAENLVTFYYVTHKRRPSHARWSDEAARLPTNWLVATPVKAWGRFAKPASPAGSPVFAALRRGRRRQLRLMVTIHTHRGSASAMMITDELGLGKRE